MIRAAHGCSEMESVPPFLNFAPLDTPDGTGEERRSLQEGV